MNTSLFPHLDGVDHDGYESLEAKARALEAFETDPWAADAILRSELLTQRVLDPCCGTGVLSKEASDHGYEVVSSDIAEWGYSGQNHTIDFLQVESAQAQIDRRLSLENWTCFMNPPFSKAVPFVNKAMELGARKVVCFQRFSWRESFDRRQWWQDHPPARVYVCGDRATCWRFDIAAERRKAGPSGRGSTPTTHAWFVWERGHPAAAALGAVHKER